jgi:hypothetical protein
VFLATYFKRQLDGNRGTGFVDTLFAGKYLAGADQRLGLGPAFDKTAFNKKNVGTLPGRRDSAPPLGRLGFAFHTQRRHRRGDDIGAG